jgi:prepilin peptidase CpaA
LIAVLAIAVVTDLRTRKIYNWLTFPALTLGFLLNGWRDGGHGLLFSIAGVGIASIALLLFILLGGMGAGDVKLLWAVGAIMGPNFTLWTLLYTAIGGGLIGVIYSMKRGVLIHTVKNALLGGHVFTTVRSADSLEGMAQASKAGKMPYAPAIALGAFATHILLIKGIVSGPW